MDMGQNGRIKKKRERRGFGEEDRNGYGSNWENREIEGKERVWGGRQEWIRVKMGEKRKEGTERVWGEDRDGYGAK